MYGHNQYQQAAANTAGPAQLVLMLYDGALVRVQAIVDELAMSLDMNRGGEVARNLAELYDYCSRQLIDANIHKDAGLVADVEAVIHQLRDAWDQGVVRGAVAVAG